MSDGSDRIIAEGFWEKRVRKVDIRSARDSVGVVALYNHERSSPAKAKA